ncbi:ATP-binding protein [Thomasclavelia sp.]|uniref:ATP-binding protein n=1 Tax=Thomasclavelia sp. TaxID=3025757 RepID=UPI0025E1A63D|nr:ATP-binding protein [Thomasclavelia sp.]
MNYLKTKINHHATFLFIINELILLFITFYGYFFNNFFQQFIVLIILILNINTIYLYFNICTNIKHKALTETKQELLKKQYIIQNEYNLAIEENNRIINNIKHDVIEQLKNNQSFKADETNILNIIKNKSSFYQTNYCQNKIVDAILYNKALVCRKNNIELAISVYLKNEININEIDLISLFTNLLDNAIEACLTLEPNQRKIEIKSRIINNYLVLSITNSYDVNKLNHDFTTTKTDHINHGIGLKIIDILIQKYHGTLKTKQDHHQIQFNLTLKTLNNQH